MVGCADVRPAWVEMAQAGEAEVHDLQVEGASHYVTWGGFISRNCGFDELTQFSESQYRYLFSRLRRREGVDIPLRMRAASNPGGEGHFWVYERFFVRGLSAGRVFIPAKLEDNPHLDRLDYERSLSELDDVTRAQLRRGDWTVRDKNNALVPEWTPEVEATCTVAVPRPSHFTPHVVGDLGSRDLTVWLFGYPGFERNQLVVEDELTLRDPSTHAMAVGILRKLLSLWGDGSQRARDLAEVVDALNDDAPTAKQSQHLRELVAHLWPKLVLRSDVDWRLVKDFERYGLRLVPTEKDDALGAVNRLRSRIGAAGVRVHPRCYVLLQTLKTATWNTKRTDWQRTDATGHADAWAAFIYLNRNADFTANPAPPKAPHVVGRSVLPPSYEKPVAPSVRVLADIFGRKPR